MSEYSLLSDLQGRFPTRVIRVLWMLSSPGRLNYAIQKVKSLYQRSVTKDLLKLRSKDAWTLYLDIVDEMSRGMPMISARHMLPYVLASCPGRDNSECT